MTQQMPNTEATLPVVLAEHAFLEGPIVQDFIREENLADIFRASAARMGEKTLYISDGRQVSWAQADAITDTMALALAEMGARPGKVLGLWMLRGIDALMAQVAIAKTGAAFLPFDADAPLERVETCLKDAQAIALVVSGAQSEKASGAVFPVLTVEALQTEKEGDAAAMALALPRSAPSDPAYLIYTSGSTGVPKGIVISNRNICHFLRAGNSLYAINAQDIVFQCGSLAFDLSMEEIWCPYLVGATLVVATPDTLADLEGLGALLRQHKVSVLDLVPTLLAVLPRDLESVRLILLGGEALPPALVSRWAKPGRRILNTYGPTEATVVATLEEVAPDRPVTIGQPLPNYTCYVVDEALNLLKPGEEGELLIGGPGVAQGYLARPELTAEKFIANPFRPTGEDPVLYRSGDAVSLDAHGNLAFLGRIDDQVKIRGFRVELGEIKSLLADMPDVQQAAVVVRHEGGLDRLVAFVVAQPASVLDGTLLREELRHSLPPYMLPERFVTLDTLPRLISGKADRKALKALELPAEGPVGGTEDPHRTHTEALLRQAARQVMPGRPIGLEADFFLELGGHSLIAAQFISLVREHPVFAGITLQDIYTLRTLRKIAAMLDEKFGTAADARAADLSFTPPPFLRRFLCMLAQLAAMPVILSISTLQWLGVFITFMFVGEHDLSFWGTVGVLCGAYVSIKFGTLFLVIALKWLIIGRHKPGRYPLWGAYYFRWWLVHRLGALVHPSYLSNSPIMPLYLALIGAKVGKDAMIAHAEFGAADLVEIGDGVSIGHKAVIANAEVIGNELIIGRVVLGQRAYIGNQSIVPVGCVIGQDARLGDMTVLAPNTHIAPETMWDGSPARQTGSVDLAELPPVLHPDPLWAKAQPYVYGILILAFSAIGLIPLFPAFYVLDNLETNLVELIPGAQWYHVLPFVTWVMGAALVVFTLAFVVAMRWIILPTRLKEGRYPLHSWLYLRQWMVNLATEVSLDTLSSLYATMYMRTWYRLMGCKIGRGAEISTNIGARYDLISIGKGSFMADECVLGDEDTHRGWVTFRKTQIGDQVFVGNNAVIAHGTQLAKGTLIGVKSQAPESGHTEPGETWFGSPAIQFPVRQKFTDVDSRRTYEPPFHMKLLRAVFEAFHTTFPTMLFLTLGSIAVYVFIYPAFESGKYWVAAQFFVASSVAMPLIMVGVVCAIKWGMMGVYKPAAKPMWSWWAMRTEAVAVLYWGLGGKVLLEHLRGTAFLPMVLRLFGAKIGEGVYMDSTDITEFDCIRIGDFAVLNEMSCLQTHLYEDRVMKIGRVEIGRGVTIGAFTTVLYDTRIGEFAQLDPLTLVMKGEHIPAHTRWAGAPAQPMAGEGH